MASRTSSFMIRVTLSPAGRALYKGIKVGAHGAFEILTHDQIYAQQMLTRHLGLLNDRRPPPR